MTTYLEVAVAAPLFHTLTYGAGDVPASLTTPGSRVLVPLGRQTVTGYILSRQDNAPDGIKKIRNIKSAPDGFTLFPASMIPFFQWAARYYHHPIGEIIKNALPTGLTPRNRRLVKLLDRDRLLTFVHDESEAWIQELLQKEYLPAGTVAKLWKGKSRRLIETLAAEGMIAVEESVAKDRVSQKLSNFYHLPADKAGKLSALPLKKSEYKSLEILQSLAEEAATEWVLQADITRQYAGARKALPALVEQGILHAETRPVRQDPFGEQLPFHQAPESLSPEQDAVLQNILPVLDRQQYKPFLLHGVTGSGKTEVYLQAARKTLENGRTVLVLVPEIALATQIEGHFTSRFGDHVALQHSGLTDTERYGQWLKICRGESKIVLGARSALFAPLDNIGLIIVDEEHDGAYKQEDGFRYQARDLALVRAEQHNAVALLGSATPSISSYTHAVNGKYQLLSMTKRIENRPLPEVDIIDLRGVKTVSGKPPLFTPEMTRALKKNVECGNQSLVFLNRRGYASVTLCGDCGQPAECRHCQVSLTLHHQKNKLICHHCGFSQPGKSVCSHCRSANMVQVGFGTERIAEELTRLIPRARIARLDRDTTENRREFIRILQDFHQQKYDILVGTQMITKGHHFPHVTQVGVIWADAGLGLPDFKAAERTFQLLTQVFGRAGRGEKTGRVLVQTFHPEHYSILAARTNDYAAFYQHEIKLRKGLSFPPFSRLINLCFEGEADHKVEAAAMQVKSKIAPLCTKHGVGMLGPAPAPLAKLRGRYRWQLLLKGSRISSLHAIISHLRGTPAYHVPLAGVKMAVDVDPENML